MEQILLASASLIALGYLLGKSADLLEDAFVSVGKQFHITPFVIGFLVISFASSLPDMSVAVFSAINDNPELSVGHLLGGSLILVTFVLFLNLMRAKQIKLGQGTISVRQLLLTVLVLLSQVAVLLDSQLSHADGLILIGAYLAGVIYVTGHKHTRKHVQARIDKTSLRHNTLIWGKAIIGLIAILILSNLIIQLAVDIATTLEVSPAVIGILLLALGTNLPEMTIMLRYHNNAEHNLATGNVLGSAALNTGTLGLLALVSPHDITNLASLVPVIVLLTISLFVFAFFAYTDKRITLRESYVLLALYVIFLALELFLLSQATQSL